MKIFTKVMPCVLPVVFICNLNIANAKTDWQTSSHHNSASIATNTQKASYLATEHAKQKFNLSLRNQNLSKVLYQFAASANFTLDIHPSIDLNSSIHLVQKNLLQILDALLLKHNLSYEIDTQINNSSKTEQISVTIVPKFSFWQHYPVNYVYLDRDVQSDVSLNMDINNQNTVGNTSLVRNSSQHKFWLNLYQSLSQILNIKIEKNNGLEPKQKIEKPVVQIPTKSININEPSKLLVFREASMISVYGSIAQHKLVKNYLDKIKPVVNKQVLIEVSIVEIFLDDNFQAGVDWSYANADGNLIQNTTQNAINNPTFQLQIQNSEQSSSQWTIRFLQQFGETKVLSSPRIMVINNQTAMLKIVDNEVYFTTQAQVNETTTSYSTDIKTIPVGLVMNITPFITDNDQVILNVRPRVSRVTSYVNDPNPDLANSSVISQVPVVQTREIESVIELQNQKTAVIGGLMQETKLDSNSGVPILADIPYLGKIFNYENRQVVKSELVILIRPTIL